MDTDLSALLVFRHLAQTGSFSETGRHWNLSQPAVSQMISKLESSAGLILLERSSTGARLTSAGTRFLARASDVCDAYLGFIDNVRRIDRRMERRVIVGIDRSACGNLIAEKIAKQPVLAAGVTVAFRDLTTDWSEALEASQYDIVIAGRFLRAGLSQGIQEAAIFRERGITVAWNPDFHPFDPVNFAFPEILRTSVLMPDSGVVTGFASHLQMWCEHAYGHQPANTVLFPSEHEALAAASAGLGVFLGPGDVLGRLGDAAYGIVHVKTFEFLLPEAFSFGVCCRSDEHSKDVLQVASAIVKLGKKILAPVS